MGQKVNPISFRIGGLQDWRSKWFANKHVYSALLEQDIRIRQLLLESLKESLVDRIEIERSRKSVTVTVYAAKPGIIIGRGGAGVEKLKKEITRKYLPPKTNLQINIQEVRQPNLHAAISAQLIVNDLEKRIPFRRAMRQAMGRIEKEGAKGYKIQVKGRLNGAEIARSESMAFGLIPLHTIRADIDYANKEAHTTYGVIGVKVWIFKGEVFEKVKETKESKPSKWTITKKS